MKELSILIPTLPARIDSYANLIKILNKQVTENNLINRVQILSLCDTKEISVGQKRNILLNKSVGKYVCFIDDDDLIAPDYLIKLINAISSNADVITFCGDYVENTVVTPFSISMVHRGNFNHPNIFYRLPNHLCPVKREIALSSQFTDKNFGEDSDYAERINKQLKNEFHIQDKLYFYMYNEATSQTKPNNTLNAFN
jgi:glycosyltransferase involved in cell wall biosynthesis